MHKMGKDCIAGPDLRFGIYNSFQPFSKPADYRCGRRHFAGTPGASPDTVPLFFVQSGFKYLAKQGTGIIPRKK